MKGIYQIKNTINNKIYIGSSITVEIRLKTHKKQLRNNYHFNNYLQREVNKYGLENFEFSVLLILDSITRKELVKKEKEIVLKLNTIDAEIGYNLVIPIEFGEEYIPTCKEGTKIKLKKNIFIKQFGEYDENKFIEWCKQMDDKYPRDKERVLISLKKEVHVYDYLTKEFKSKHISLVEAARFYNFKPKKVQEVTSFNPIKKSEKYTNGEQATTMRRQYKGLVFIYKEDLHRLEEKFEDRKHPRPFISRKRLAGDLKERTKEGWQPIPRGVKELNYIQL